MWCSDAYFTWSWRRVSRRNKLLKDLQRFAGAVRKKAEETAPEGFRITLHTSRAGKCRGTETGVPCEFSVGNPGCEVERTWGQCLWCGPDLRETVNVRENRKLYLNAYRKLRLEYQLKLQLRLSPEWPDFFPSAKFRCAGRRGSGALCHFGGKHNVGSPNAVDSEGDRCIWCSRTKMRERWNSSQGARRAILQSLCEFPRATRKDAEDQAPEELVDIFRAARRGPCQGGAGGETCVFSSLNPGGRRRTPGVFVFGACPGSETRRRTPPTPKNTKEVSANCSPSTKKRSAGAWASKTPRHSSRLPQTPGAMR